MDEYQFRLYREYMTAAKEFQILRNTARNDAQALLDSIADKVGTENLNAPVGSQWIFRSPTTQRLVRVEVYQWNGKMLEPAESLERFGIDVTLRLLKEDGTPYRGGSPRGKMRRVSMSEFAANTTPVPGDLHGTD